MKKSVRLLFLIIHVYFIFAYNIAEIKSLGEKESIKQLPNHSQTLVKLIADYLPDTPTYLIGKRYAHYSGINAGYCFFSPDIPTPITVVFELSNPQGESIRQAPLFHTKKGQSRFLSNVRLFKSFEKIQNLLAFSWAVRTLELNPNYTQVSVIVGFHQLASMKMHREGQLTEFCEIISYDFDVK